MRTGLEFPLKKDTSRKIIHIDMDAFFASIEERDHPEYKGRPLVIAQHPNLTKGKGVVSTANYEARKYGIHSAMSSRKAYELCPEAIFVRGNYQYYQQVSKQIHEIFLRYTDLMEPIALDEAYLDVTNNKIGGKSAIKIAGLIQYDIWKELDLTCSAGVSYNKFIAKLASDYKKPSGLTVVLPDEAEEFLQKLPIEKFHGVGRKSVVKFHDLGIMTGADLLKYDEMELIQLFGKMGYSLYRKVRGIHDAPVTNRRERKSIGRETTLIDTIYTEEELIIVLRRLAQSVSESLAKNRKQGKTVTLKVRYSNFETITKRLTLREYIHTTEEIYFNSFKLWQSIDDLKSGIRLLGISMTSLNEITYQEIKLPLD